MSRCCASAARLGGMASDPAALFRSSRPGRLPVLTSCSAVTSPGSRGGGARDRLRAAEIVDLFLLYRHPEVTSGPDVGVMERGRAMLDPVLHHLQQAKQTAIWVAQLMRVDPDLMLPAALPLLAARLMDAGGAEDEAEDGDQEMGLAVG